MRIIISITLLLLASASGFGYVIQIAENEPIRINIVAPSIGFTGGGVTIWYIAACLIKGGFKVRHFIQDQIGARPPNSTVARFESLHEDLRNIGNLMEFDSGERPVRCNPQDLWMATWCFSWDLVYLAQSQLRNSRPLYLIQDDERWLNADLATRSYAAAHYAIFNGPPLRDWFVSHNLGVFSNGEKHGDEYSYVATPALGPRIPITASLLAARRAPLKGKKRLVVYYRRHAARNQPQLILSILSELVLRKIVSMDEWDFVGVSDHGPESICTLADNTACMHIPEMLAAKEYDELLGSCDVAISFCTSGGASWPIMDFATHGAVVITNVVSDSHRQFFESLSPIVLTSYDLTLDVLVTIVTQGINISNSLSLEKRARIATQAASRFPDRFCAGKCFGHEFIEKMHRWFNNETLPRRKSKSYELVELGDTFRNCRLYFYGLILMAFGPIFYRIVKRMLRIGMHQK